MPLLSRAENRFLRQRLNAVRHVTLDPGGPGVVRIHLVPRRGGWRDVPFEAFYAAVSDGVVEDTHYLPLLEEFLFSQVRLTDRVVWFAAQVTVPAGGSVEVTADYTKSASLNFGPPDMDYKDLCGYSLLPQAGSSLTFTSQTAVLTGGEDLSLYGGNLNLGETALTEERYALYVLQ